MGRMRVRRGWNARRIVRALCAIAAAAAAAAAPGKPVGAAGPVIGILPFIDATASGNRSVGNDVGSTMQAELAHSTSLVSRVLPLGSIHPEDVDAKRAVEIGRAHKVDRVFVGTVLEARSEESNKTGWLPSIGGQSGRLDLRAIKADVTLQGELYDVESGRRLTTARVTGHHSDTKFSGTAYTKFGSWGRDQYGTFLDSPMGRALQAAISDLVKKIAAP